MNGKKISIKVGSGRISFLGALFLIVFTLKLTGHITFSWWLVTAPLWGIPVIILTFMMFAGLIALIAALVERK